MSEKEAIIFKSVLFIKAFSPLPSVFVSDKSSSQVFDLSLPRHASNSPWASHSYMATAKAVESTSGDVEIKDFFFVEVEKSVGK